MNGLALIVTIRASRTARTSFMIEFDSKNKSQILLSVYVRLFVFIHTFESI
jgi:hypothetical protein